MSKQCRISAPTKRRQARFEVLEPRRVLSGDPLITEFMASNDSTLLDGDGNSSDWIEIHNPTTTPINLAGWHLTDDAGNLDKWTFPAAAQSILDPAEYLVVFASGQSTETYIDPAGYLHTDFKLGASGEYLGLITPGLSVASEYAPEYPEQISDVSYGPAPHVWETEFVGPQNTTTALTPTSGELDASSTDVPPAWTTIGFDDSAWASSTSGVGVGYEEGEVRPPDDPDGVLSPGGLIGFDLTDSNEDGVLEVEIGPATDFNSPGHEGPPNALDSTVNTKWLAFNPTGASYEVQFVDGQAFAVDGYTITSANDAPERDPYAWTLSGSHDGINYTTLNTRAAQDFGDRHETRLYEFNNVIPYEFYKFDFLTEYGVTGDNRPNSIQLAEIELFSSAQIGYQSLIDLDVQTAWDAAETSVYQRIEFDVTDPAEYAALTLEMQYDDGFVAYLNGQRVASSHAPSLPHYQSHATAQIDDDDAIVPESFDVSDGIDALVAGTNVLAIHVLNLTDDSSDLLSRPRLVGVGVEGATAIVGYMPSPSPGAANLSAGSRVGPSITEVTDHVAQPGENQDLTITATVNPLLLDVAEVVLNYRVMYGAETAVAMLDDGLGADVLAGDGVYTAVIPSSTYSAGEMVRWYVTAGDSLDNQSRYPVFFSSADSAEYLGTVVADAPATTNLEVFQYFVENTNLAGTETGTRGSVFFGGEFYDNVFVRRRGGNTTQGRKFEFNSGQHFLFDPAYPRVDEINLNERGAESTYMRQVLSWDVYAAAGVPASIGRPWYTVRNNSYLDVRIYVEQPDSDLLRRTGLDDNGALYKIGKDGVENSVTSSTVGVHKRTRKAEDNSDLQALVDGVSPSNPNRSQYVYDNVDIAGVINYIAATAIVHDNDHPHKNYHLYRDTEGSGQWTFLPWDKDLTFGLNFGISGVIGDLDPFSHPFFGDSDHQKIDNQWNRLIDAVLDAPGAKELYLRRLRTLMDDLLGIDGSSWIDQQIAQLQADLAPQLDSSDWLARIAQITDEYLPERRQHLFVNHSVDNPSYPDNAGIPAAQVGTPSIQFGQVDVSPVGGNQDQEYIELINPNEAAVDLSGWRVQGAEIDYTFRAGTVIPGGGSLYLAADVPSFLTRATGPTGGELRLVQGNYDARLTSLGETLTLTASDGQLVSQTTTTAIPDATDFLRVSEINYHPHDVTTAESSQLPGVEEDDFEFIELVNTHATNSVDLSGVVLSGGANAVLGSVTLAPGERGVLVSDAAAFAVRYGAGPTVLGAFTGDLSNNSQTIKLQNPLGDLLAEVTYNDSDPWSGAADGGGATLEFIDPTDTPRDLADKWYNWRASADFGGSPGETGTPPSGVVINEVLTHTSDPQQDAIELLNTSSQPVDIGGWCLSDSRNELKKFSIPVGTVLQPGAYVVFDESDFNPNPSNPGPNHFLLNGAEGEDVWLVAASRGVLEGIQDYVEFGAALDGESFGRVPNGAGRLSPNAAVTLGSANSVARQANVVISEVSYHPENPSPASQALFAGITDKDLEFIEIYNAGLSTVDLSDWRLRGEADFDFSAGTLLDVGQTLVVVSFDPQDASLDAAFRAHYGIDSGVTLVGGYAGGLSNSYGRITLQRPDDPPLDEPSLTPYVIEDEVLYDDQPPWATVADGEGASLVRVAQTLGNSPESWSGELPSPGTAQFDTALAGDYDRNSVVDQADYALWRRTYGSTISLNADGNHDGVVDAADFSVWRDNQGSFAATSAVASPTTVEAASPQLAASPVAVEPLSSESSGLASAFATRTDVGDGPAVPTPANEPLANSPTPLSLVDEAFLDTLGSERLARQHAETLKKESQPGDVEAFFLAEGSSDGEEPLKLAFADWPGME